MKFYPLPPVSALKRHAYRICCSFSSVSLAGLLFVSLFGANSEGKPNCPTDMALIPGNVCIDRYEGSLVEKKNGREVSFSPYESPHGHVVKAKSRAGVIPQAYISKLEAEGACKEAHKRLCTEKEWVTACKGKNPTTYPYGEDHKDRYCNDHGTPPLSVLYSHLGEQRFTPGPMNDPKLNQVPVTVSRTGAHKRCVNGFRVYDMVGNVHEWVSDTNGTFRGGYYLDTLQNGEGCKYRTDAHNVSYHDYSTGFRCCKDL